MADDNDDDLTPEEEDKFGRFLARHMEAEKRKAERAKPPKDFGDALDRIADAVIDRLDQRVAERQREREAADETPTRGGDGKGGFLKMLGG